MKISSHTVRNTFACAALLTGSLFSANLLAQTEEPAEIPTSLQGTYELTFAYEQNGSPIANGTTLEFVFAPGNYVCVAGAVIGDPVLRNGNAHEATWTVEALDLEIALSSLVSGFNEVNIGGIGGSPFYGQFQGSKTSNATDCEGLEPEPDLTAINTLFDLAAEKFAALFGQDSGVVNQEIEGYIYRYYPTTGFYLAVKDNQVHILGGDYTDITTLGTVASITEALEAIVVDVVIPEGDATLVLTGTVSVNGLTTAIPQITIEDIPMPSASDVDDVRDAVLEQYADVGITGSISVELISESSNSIVFNIQFSASQAAGPITVTSAYDITYTYTAN
ncbi:MAG: hypothetical protein R3332_11155 [Pseudohongiellaceae bacterium]|nr:hypothetical protein [Pseudohongiellaceae bacterium]